MWKQNFCKKHYSDNAFPNAYAIDVFANYDIKIRRTKSLLEKVSPLVRYDYLSDHSDGISFGDTSRLVLDDPERHRLTTGLTFSLATPFVADLRVNYEKYFYNQGVIANQSERDKIVFELIAHF
ncbi:MAG: hypothetical protein ACI3Y0_05775 [Prevotella sp.]